MSAMDQDDDEFLYGNHSSAFLPSITTMVPTPVSSSPTVPGLSVIAPSPGPATVAKQDHSTPAALPTQLEHEELEEGEEEDQEEVEVSDDEDEIELVIVRKDGSRPEPPPRPERYNQIRTAPPRPTSTSAHARLSPTSPAPAVPVALAVTTSKLDINAMPNYDGTPISKISMESDILPSEKPWRKPGSDVTDYFNYGFDEFTWTAYCQKQEGLRDEFSPQKMMEQMMLMSGMGISMMPTMDPSQVGDMSTMIGGTFGLHQGQGGPGGGGPSGGPQQGSNSGQTSGQGIEMMGDPSMFMSGPGFDGRGPQDASYGMGRGGIPPQGPSAGQMGAYSSYDQSIMQGARSSGAFGPRGARGNRRW